MFFLIKNMINERHYFIECQNKIKKLFFSISFVSTCLTIYILFIRYLYKTNKNIDDIDINNNNIRIRDVLEEESKYSLLTNLNDIIMEGNWKDTQNNNGTTFIHYFTNNKLYPTKLKVIFRFIYGNTIENWIMIYSTIYIRNISFEKININKTQFNANSSVLIERGKLFKRNNFYKYESSIQLNISKENSSIVKIDGLIQINAEQTYHKFSFNAIRQEHTNQNNKRKIKIYTIYLSILVIFIFIINQITIRYANNSTTNAKSISIFTAYSNLISSGYGCFFHFYLILTDNCGFKYYCFLGAIFFLNFCLADYRFLNIIWKVKNQNILNNYEIFRKKSVKFYLLSYFILFLLLLFMIDVIFNIYMSILCIIFTWLPQIIFNFYYYNRTSLPYSYIIINSLLRLFPSLYFFMYKDNLLFFPQKNIVVFINIFLMFLLIVFMQCQIYIGPRFFLPKKYNINYNSLYRTKIELLSQIKNIPNECSICLGPLLDVLLLDFNNSNNINNSYKNNSTETSKSYSIDTKNIINNETLEHNNKNVVIKQQDNLNMNKDNIILKNNFSCINVIKIIISIIIKSFNFFTISNNKYNKEYIITPCKHVFHSICLEKWFERKKECPCCRSEIDNLI